MIRLRHRVRDWRRSRCDARWCWRKETVVDVEWDGWCVEHSFGKIVNDEE